MSQRIYWVPHTICFLGCEHCHNDSGPDGSVASQELLARVVEHLPRDDSPHRLEEVLIGGGETLVPCAEIDYLVRALRRRFPQRSQGTLAERRATGQVILALQTNGLPLADSRGHILCERIVHWLGLGVDYFQVASSDSFHRRQRPDYPWEKLEGRLRAYSETNGVEFLIYGKQVVNLVPSGRVLDSLEMLEGQGARLLKGEGYCRDGWETGSHFLSGSQLPYPGCSEIVIDPEGWVHPCCWYELSPGLFDLSTVGFDAGIEEADRWAYCLAIDQGDILALAGLAGLEPTLARQVRDGVGDCGACRLFSMALADKGALGQGRVQPLSEREAIFYAELLSSAVLARLLA